MKRNVYFEGELGEKFVPHLSMNFKQPAEIFQCLDANFSDYRHYMIKQHEEGVHYHIDVAGNELEDPAELLMELKEGDVTITPVPAGAKSGPMKILAAIALVVVTGGAAAVAAAGSGTALGGGLGAIQGGLAMALSGGLGTGAMIATQMTLGMAMSLAVGGITQMMAPDPSVDGDSEQSYLFNGAQQNTVAGDPIPVLYGRLRVPGQPISFELSGKVGQQNYSGYSGGTGYGNGGGSFNSTLSGGLNTTGGVIVALR